MMTRRWVIFVWYVVRCLLVGQIVRKEERIRIRSLPVQIGQVIRRQVSTRGRHVSRCGSHLFASSLLCQPAPKSVSKSLASQPWQELLQHSSSRDVDPEYQSTRHAQICANGLYFLLACYSFTDEDASMFLPDHERMARKSQEPLARLAASKH